MACHEKGTMTQKAISTMDQRELAKEVARVASTAEAEILMLLERCIGGKIPQFPSWRLLRRARKALQVALASTQEGSPRERSLRKLLDTVEEVNGWRQYYWD